MNEELQKLQEILRHKRPMDWDALPDIPLYMDQVLAYMDRQVIHTGGDALTSAMVNNYTKGGLVPRAEGKKYSREHLAYLTAICVLKQVLSAREMAVILEDQAAGGGEIETLYRRFRDSLDKALLETASEMDAYLEEDQLSEGAAHFALLSYAAGLASRRYVEILRDKRGEPGPREKRGRNGKTASHGEA